MNLINKDPTRLSIISPFNPNTQTGFDNRGSTMCTLPYSNFEDNSRRLINKLCQINPDEDLKVKQLKLINKIVALNTDKKENIKKLEELYYLISGNTSHHFSDLIIDNILFYILDYIEKLPQVKPNTQDILDIYDRIENVLLDVIESNDLNFYQNLLYKVNIHDLDVDDNIDSVNIIYFYFIENKQPSLYEDFIYLKNKYNQVVKKIKQGTYKYNDKMNSHLNVFKWLNTLDENKNDDYSKLIIIHDILKFETDTKITVINLMEKIKNMKNKVLIGVEIIDIIKFQKMFDEVYKDTKDFNINRFKITKIHNFKIIKNKNYE